ncbi:MAG: FAD-dependent oxidoreductase [Pseudomonadota bacterium]
MTIQGAPIFQVQRLFSGLADMPRITREGLANKIFDVCVVGAGPAGMAVALASRRRGLSVLLLESGGAGPTASTHDLSRAEFTEGSRHAEVEHVSCRAVGGTSHFWGGRCVPFDPIDFSSRPGLRDATWPISYAEMQAWHGEAARFLGCGEQFTDPSDFGLHPDSGLHADALEQWSPQTNMLRRHRRELYGKDGPEILTGATVTGFDYDNDPTQQVQSVSGLKVVCGGESAVARARHYVLACGGLETTRLLLVEQRRTPSLFGGDGGPLGAYYMGHMTGVISTLTFEDASMSDQFDFFRLCDRQVARRRFSLSAEMLEHHELSNIVFWVENLPIADASHRSGIRSLKLLVLSQPWLGRLVVPEAIRRYMVTDGAIDWPAHMRNVREQPGATLRELWRLVRSKYFESPPLPERLITSTRGRYALRYHAEHLPNSANRVRLGNSTDRLGMPRIRINFRYGDADSRSILRAHDLLMGGINNTDAMTMAYVSEPQAREASIRDQATDGYHQIGTTRMSATRRHGVVDENLRVHDFDNLFVASSSVFPSSGQCNPTFPLVALSARLASHLAERDSSQERPASVRLTA